MIQTNGDGSIDKDEFNRLCRHVESMFYRIHIKDIDGIFEAYAVQLEDSPELVLTPKCFEELCNDNYIFNQDTFEKFFDDDKKRGFCRGVDDLVEKWEKVKEVLKAYLKKMSHDSLNILWAKVDGFILSINESTDKHKLWLNYKILECETNRIHVESQIRSLMPREMAILTASLDKQQNDISTD